MGDGLGMITWWGFSPCIDLLRHGDASAEVCEINILLVGSGDSRHLLQTLAKRYLHKPVKLNFYIIESSLELYARHILFLSLALEPRKRYGLQEKTEMFLELFGNSLVRLQTMDYVERMCHMFIRFVTDSEYLTQTLPGVDLSKLKYKERDFLEGIFKMWMNRNQKVFDIKLCWDLRLRQCLKERFDSIPGPFDWDYNMKLAEKDAGIITGRKYNRWRETGIAFEVREATYDTTNNTLASGIVLKQEGESHLRRGYWGDIIASPYLAYGIECEDKSFFKTANHNYIKSSEDISAYNVMSMLHEITEQKKYVPVKTADVEQQSATITEITEEEEEDTSNAKEQEDTTPVQDVPYESVSVPAYNVTFLPLQSAASLHNKQVYRNKFDIVYFSNSMVHHLTDDLSQTFAAKSHLILETAKYMIDLPKDTDKEFIRKVTTMAKNVGCKPCSDVDEEKDCFLHFTYQR